MPFNRTHWTVGINFPLTVRMVYPEVMCSPPAGASLRRCQSPGTEEFSLSSRHCPHTRVGKGGVLNGFPPRFARLAHHQGGPRSESPEGHQLAVLRGLLRGSRSVGWKRGWEGHGSSARDALSHPSDLGPFPPLPHPFSFLPSPPSLPPPISLRSAS